MMSTQNTLLLLALFTLLVGGVSCGQKEHIDPFALPTTAAQSQGKDPELTVVSGGFVFDEVDVSNPVGSVPVPILGIFVENLAGLFADIFVLLNNNWEVEQDPQTIDIPEFDTSYFKELQIQNLDFAITGGDNNKAALDFIENLTIYVANEKMWEKGEKIMLAQYNFDRAALKRCKKKCLNLKVAELRNGTKYNIMPLLEGSKKLFIIPKVKINSIPKSEFKISGNIDFRLAFKLPF